MNKKTYLCNLKPGEIFTVFGKRFVKLEDNGDDGSLVLAADIWKMMPFRTVKDSEEAKDPNNFLKSDVLDYLATCLPEMADNGAVYEDFKPFQISLEDTTGQCEYGEVENRIGLLTLRQYGKYWRMIPAVDAPWWLATPYGTPNSSPYTYNSNSVWSVKSDGSYDYWNCSSTYGVRPAFNFNPSLLVSVECEDAEETELSQYSLDDLLAEIKKRIED